MASKKQKWPPLPIGELLMPIRRPVDVDPAGTYRQIGIRSHCKGIFHKPETTGKRIGDKRVFWVQPGCFILNIIFAWEQAVAMTSDAEAGMIASHRFPMFRSRNGKLLPEYAWRYFTSARGKYDLNIASPGGAGRNKTLGQEEFKRLKIPLPPIEEQQRIVRILSDTDRAIRHVSTLIAAKRRLKEAIAKYLLSGNRRLPGFTRPWKTRKLGNLATLLFSGIDKKTRPNESKVRLCNYTDVYYNDRITANIEFMLATAKATEISRFSLKKGDVLITKDSETPGDIAKPAIVEEDLPGVICGYHLETV